MTICPQCRKEFVPKRPKQQLCSRACSGRANGKKHASTIPVLVRRKAAMARFKQRHPERVRTGHRSYYVKHKDAIADKALDRRYGQGTTEHLALQLQLQSNACGICGECLTRPNLDHNHQTGQRRGALCAHCNHGLGYIEQTNFLAKALDYLKKWKGKQ
jgi:hypothetical protein